MKKWWLLVLILLLLMLAFLFGGEVIAVLSPPPTATPTLTATNTPIPTDTITPTSTSTDIPTATLTSTETPIPCFNLVEPEDGAEIDRTMGKLTFAWTEQYGAAGYLFAITIPSGYVEEKELAETSFERWLESLPLGGEYVWVVEAVNGEGDVLCTAGPFTFSKSEYAAPSNNTGASGGSSVGGGLDPNGDADGDGVLNGDDACPYEPGFPDDGGCPPGGGQD